METTSKIKPKFSQPSFILPLSLAASMSEFKAPYKWEDLVRARLTRKLTNEESIAFARMNKFRKLNEASGEPNPPNPVPQSSMEEKSYDAFGDNNVPDHSSQSAVHAPPPHKDVPPPRNDEGPIPLFPLNPKLPRRPLFEIRPQQPTDSYSTKAVTTVLFAAVGAGLFAAANFGWRKLMDFIDKRVEENEREFAKDHLMEVEPPAVVEEDTEFLKQQNADPPKQTPSPQAEIMAPLAPRTYHYRTYAP